LLTRAQSGLTFLAIVPSATLLFVYARLIEESKRPYFLASAWTGAAGAFASFVLLWPIQPPYEEISMFLGSTITATLMFLFMSLSGFKPK
jgi:hypothetical protein